MESNRKLQAKLDFGNTINKNSASLVELQDSNKNQKSNFGKMKMQTALDATRGLLCPSHFAGSAGSTDSADDAASAGSTALADAAASAGSTDLADAAASAGSTDLVDAVASAGSTDLVDAVASAGSTNSADASASAASTNSAEAAASAGSTDSAGAAAPIGSIDSDLAVAAASADTDGSIGATGSINNNENNENVQQYYELSKIEYFNQLPDDFADGNWMFKALPKGLRFLVVAEDGETTCYLKSKRTRNTICKFETFFPGGNHLLCRNTTILECFFNIETSTFLVMDVQVWDSVSLLDYDVSYRFKWLEEKFESNIYLREADRLCSFVHLKYQTGTVDDLEKLYLEPLISHQHFTIEKHGIVLYHKLSPRRGWIEYSKIEAYKAEQARSSQQA